MERIGNNEGETPYSHIEQARQKAFETVLGELDTRIASGVRDTFVAWGKEYPITNSEDMLVARAQQLLEETEVYYDEVVQKDAYREEQAVVKILRLFEAYEKLMTLYAELLSQYPQAATRVESYLPALKAAQEHGRTLFDAHTADGTK